MHNVFAHDVERVVAGPFEGHQVLVIENPGRRHRGGNEDGASVYDLKRCELTVFIPRIFSSASKAIDINDAIG